MLTGTRAASASAWRTMAEPVDGRASHVCGFEVLAAGGAMGERGQRGVANSELRAALQSDARLSLAE